MENTPKATKAVAKETKPTKIGRVAAAKMITESKGSIFTATFTTKNNTQRTMNCRLGVQKGVKENPKKKAVDTTALGMITVFDMQEKGFKKLNLQTLSALKINKGNFQIK